jgi:hypothetical protein
MSSETTPHAFGFATRQLHAGQLADPTLTLWLCRFTRHLPTLLTVPISLRAVCAGESVISTRAL